MTTHRNRIRIGRSGPMLRKSADARARFESVAIYNNAIFNLGGDASTPPEALYGLQVSGEPFSHIGRYPHAGS